MQINSQNSYSPNFTAITNARVMMNGRPYIHRENIKSAARQLQTILTSPANGDERLIAIKTAFCQYVKDFKYAAGANVKKDTIIRNIPDVDLKKFSAEISDENLVYVFTGSDAEALAQKGKKIGPERTASDAYLKKQLTRNGVDFSDYKKGHNDRFRSGEEFEKDIDYYSKAKSLVANDKRHIQKNGNILELIINVVRDEKGKISIQNIFFKEKVKPRPIKEEPTQPVSTISKVIKKTKRVAKKLKNKVSDSQLSLF